VSGVAPRRGQDGVLQGPRLAKIELSLVGAGARAYPRDCLETDFKSRSFIGPEFLFLVIQFAGVVDGVIGVIGVNEAPRSGVDFCFLVDPEMDDSDVIFYIPCADVVLGAGCDGGGRFAAPDPCAGLGSQSLDADVHEVLSLFGGGAVRDGFLDGLGRGRGGRLGRCGGRLGFLGLAEVGGIAYCGGRGATCASGFQRFLECVVSPRPGSVPHPSLFGLGILASCDKDCQDEQDTDGAEFLGGHFFLLCPIVGLMP